MSTEQLKKDLQDFRQDLSKISIASNNYYLRGNNFYVTSKFPSFHVELKGSTCYSTNIKCEINTSTTSYSVPKNLTTAEEIYRAVEDFVLDEYKL